MNIALIIVLVLLLGANNRQKKYPVKVTYDGGKPYWYDYDWRVSAMTPIRIRILIGDTRTAQDHEANRQNEEAVNYHKDWLADMERRQLAFDGQYELGEEQTDWMGVKFKNIYQIYVGYVGNTRRWSKFYDFDNTPEFYASEAEQVIQSSYEAAVIWAADPMYSNYEPIPPEQWGDPIIETTTTFQKYYKKDMALDALVPMVKDLIIKLITKKIAPPAA
jgi:hypothetical protein